MIQRAKEIAQSVHGNQKDKKNYPYMSHIFDVAKRVSHLGEKDEVVALLHDAIEDAEPLDFKKEVTAQIEVAFDEEVVLAIKAMSKNDHNNARDINNKSKRTFNYRHPSPRRE